MSELPVISVENLSKRYIIGHETRQDTLRDRLSHGIACLLRGRRTIIEEEFWALRDMSFDIRSGEVVGVIGRNGAGKSTLLKILSRITEPTAGRVTLRGRVASLLEVGTGFHPELTGRENIYLNGAILGMSRLEIARKFDEIVAFAEVEHFLDTPVKRYSSGMYVRLAFAVAAHLEPEILIVDEVLAVGDQQFQEKCLGKIRQVTRQDARTVLFVSHNLKSVEQLCDRAIHLKNGRVTGIGPASEVVSQFIHAGNANHSAPEDLRLSPKLVLRRFTLDQPECPGRGSLGYQLQITATESVTIQEIFILVQNLQGERVGLLDLRRPDGARRLAAGNTLTISGAIAPCPLVEGEYVLGLFMHADNEQREHRDLIKFNVRPAPPRHGLPAIVTQALGIALLEGDYHEEIERAR
jgi:lipopolysaccharide transport system ATP-binding protein